jgi:hypothetical protein
MAAPISSLEGHLILYIVPIFFVIIALVYAVRGMMYYRKALELQAFLDMANNDGISNSSLCCGSKLLS